MRYDSMRGIVRRQALMLFAVIAVLGVTGCAGEDGKDGLVTMFFARSPDITAADVTTLVPDAGGAFPSTSTEFVVAGFAGNVTWASSGTNYIASVILPNDPGQEGKDGVLPDPSGISLPPVAPITADDGEDGDPYRLVMLFQGNTIKVIILTSRIIGS